jgi:hypothetical protein
MGLPDWNSTSDRQTSVKAEGLAWQSFVGWNQISGLAARLKAVFMYS